MGLGGEQPTAGHTADGDAAIALDGTKDGGVGPSGRRGARRRSLRRMRARYLCQALAAGLVLAAGGSVTATPAHRPRIVNGIHTEDYPTAGALLFGSSASSAGMVCSGTLVGCETFLTAAHCVCDTSGPDCQSGPGAADPSQFFVFLQHAGTFAVSSIAVHPDYEFPVADVAVVKLAAPVTGIAPTPIDLTASPSPGTVGTIVGFGRQGGFEYDYGLKRVGQVSLAPCTDGVSDTTSVCWEFESPLGPPGTDSNTCNGDSGGPLLVDFGCGAVVAGVTSGGSSDDCAPADASYDADVHYYRGYIQAEGGPDLNAASCGAMPQVGDAGANVDGFFGTVSGGTPEGVHAFTVPSGTAQARVTMNALDDGSDFDLYVKAGSPPTTSDYDCRDIGSNQFAFCGLASPTAGTWYAMVRRVVGTGTYQVTAATFASGPPGGGTNGLPCDDQNVCTGSDVCQAGQCVGSPVPDGTSCDDGRVCTSPDACVAGACGGTPGPLIGCHVPSLPGASTVKLRDKFLGTSDSLSWRWRKGDTTLAELGSPLTTTGYDLCVFDEESGVPSLGLEARVPPGPGWKGSSTGFKFADRPGSNGGITGLRLKASPTNAAVVLKAKGPSLLLPPMPLSQDPRVTVQLSNGSACWQARFTTSTRNDDAQFKARSD